MRLTPAYTSIGVKRELWDSDRCPAFECGGEESSRKSNVFCSCHWANALLVSERVLHRPGLAAPRVPPCIYRTASAQTGVNTDLLTRLYTCGGAEQRGWEQTVKQSLAANTISLQCRRRQWKYTKQPCFVQSTQDNY